MKTIDEIAAYWKVSRRTVEREIKRGELQAVCIRGIFRISEKQLSEYEKKHSTISKNQLS